MRPLHILDHSLPLHSGYTFRSRALIEGQRRLGWQPLMLTAPRHYAEGPDPETIDGLTFYRTRKSGLPLLGEITATAKRLDAVIEDTKPDLLHAHSPVLNFAAAWGAARRHNLPLVYEIRAFWEDAAVGNGTGREGDIRYRLTHAAESWACRRADAVGAICKGLLGDLRARGIDEAKLFEIPNAVDLTQFGDPLPRDTALGAELGLEEDVIGFLGSFYDYEGLDILIAAMPRVVAARPKAHLLLVGGGPMEASLRAAASASSASDRIRFVGRVPHSEVDRYYSLVDVLAYPRKAMRLTELVTPLKPLEAMAQEKLVAASNVGGHRELIEDGVTGTLFAADDPNAAADALIGLLEDREAWPARRARAKAWVSAERNWDRSVAAYVPVYERLLNRAR
ncbi:TIGR04063 family PEP-CTERM/XrtA system glycosyltransferase [Sphingosinicella soli]|uniref:TIGR04063 family PEP-CTERM/XrtA system glycosyltransferase n=1 Tax=Sphingosinicella soli TaxID=333708 RepID=UPI001611BD11